MPTKKRTPPATGGATSKRKRGLVSILIAVQPETRSALALAAALADKPMALWAADLLETAAREALTKRNCPWPEKIQEEKSPRSPL